MSFEPRDYLRHILAEADYLVGRTSSLSYAAFAADVNSCTTCKRAAVVLP